MNGSHLPAGQPMPGGVGGGPGGRGPPDMGPMPGPGAAGNGPRRRPPPHQYASHQPAYHHQQQHVNPGHMYYNSAMNPYANSYYPPMAHYYQGGGMPASPYLPHNPYAARSPPAMHQQYPPIVSSNMQHPPPPQPYPRPPRQQPSPAVSTPPPYQPVAPPPAPIPQTPSSTHSSQIVPAPLTPTTPQTQEVPRPQPDVEVIPARAPFKAPLPWLSRPDLPFPTRIAKSKRRKRILTTATSGVELPANQQAGIETLVEPNTKEEVAAELPVPSAPATPTPETAAASQTSAVNGELGEQSKDSVSETPGVTPTKSTKPASRAAVPAIPALPVRPKASPQDAKPVEAPATSQAPEVPPTAPAEPSDAGSKPADAPAPAPAPAKPSLWSGLFARGAPAATAANGPQATAAAASAAAAATAATVPTANGSTDAGADANNKTDTTGSFSKSNASSLAEALADFRIANGQKLAFLEPRGLINTGNMCYMNSILQVLIFCVPFYDFLDQVGKRAAHSFNSETPLIDAMIMFMREYNVIDSAVSVEKLRMRLKSEELEQFGEPFTPEFVYDAIRKLPRFASMRRGHQQDAEEFLGFLLESLHEECTHIMRHLPEPSTTANPTHSSASTATAMSSPTSATDSSDWLEVRGPKQRAAITRSSGHPITSSPLSKIFGGQLRSELKVPGLKDSVTLEPYQPLQLDIGSPQVRNIVDALKNLTRSETLHGDFGSPRGPDVTATKQVFIESVPPVLILHLKRFQFDAQGTGTMKIWKKVGYPLELELPKEVFTRGKRNTMVADGRGLPKYRLISAVYHHGKNASGGHYTVDVRRQDGREWIRMDDTVLRRVRSEDVAEGGVEEDAVKEALQSDHKRDTATGGSGNRFEGFGENEAGDDEGWNKVTTPASGGAKKWSSVANGHASAPAPAKGKQVKDSIKDNKVAYLLFYQKI